MAEPLNASFEQEPVSQHSPQQWADHQVPAIDVSSFQRRNASGVELATHASNRVRLDLDELECFEVVDTQYEDLGIRFANAIALHPSNPAFPPQSGHTVLTGAPKSGWLEATFARPVRLVSGFVTGSRSTILMGFDEANQLVAQAETLGANLATDISGDRPHTESNAEPNAELVVSAHNIYRIKFSSFGGQLAIGGISFQA